MADYNLLPVKVDEIAIARLTRKYKSAYKKIVDELITAKGFGVVMRRQLLSNIRATLTDFGVDVDEFIETELINAYKGGARDAVVQLRLQGGEVRVRSGFNRVHKQAMFALVDDGQTAFAESIQGVNRQARQLLGKAVREQITARMFEGQLTGKTLREIKKIIVADLQANGLASLVDKGGKKWSLDRYAEMLIRTKTVEARNRGLANRMAENGYDLVKVSTHGTDHKECAVWEGKILSLTGNTAGYPTVQEATEAGLFHPNCKHAINVYIPELN